MYGRRPVRQKPRTSQVKVWPAPTAGWIANRNLAQPNGQGMPQGAEVLDNFFPTTTTCILRRGRQLYATLGDGTLPVTAMFAYVVGNQQQLFAATETTIYDVTTITSALNYTLADDLDQQLETDAEDTIGENSTEGLEVYENTTGGDWVVIQFATTGGTYLIGVNGIDVGFQYDGEDFEEYSDTSTPAIEFPEGVTLGTPDLSYVFAYKARLFFIQKDSLDAWYLPVDQIGGELVKLPLGGVFERGGSLLFGASWSLDSGNQGGLSEQVIFVTTEGEVAVFQGSNPGDAQDWGKVGVYNIGRPLGKKAFIRAGSDIIIATSIGFVPLSQAIKRDVAALAPAAVSFPIEDAWNDATRLRGLENWICEIWPEAQMVMVAPPGNENPNIFVANARTGAWTRYTNWVARSMEVFQGQLYLGADNGQIFAANVTGRDDGDTYTGVYMPLFDDLGSPASLKISEVGRAVFRASTQIKDRLSVSVDFSRQLPSAPDATQADTGGEWGTAVWGESVWGASPERVMTQRWQSVAGMGYALSCAVQVTSGSTAPVDAEVVRLEITYQTADIVS